MEILKVRVLKGIATYYRLLNADLQKKNTDLEEELKLLQQMLYRANLKRKVAERYIGLRRVA